MPPAALPSTRPASQMPVRILIDPSAYWHRNIGDMAMLEVALARLRAYWPHAAIDIITLDSETMSAVDPDMRPVSPYGAMGWNADAVLVRDATPLSPGRGYVLKTCHGLRRSDNWLMTGIGRAALLAKGHDPSLLSRYLDAVRRADLVLMTGAGSINESFKKSAFVRMETLELALEAGAVTALVGQGIGPISDPILKRRVAQVLPRVDLLALREGVASPALLKEMGMSERRLRITGDDAITVAYSARAENMGSCIGVNLRIAGYSGIDRDLASAIGRVVRNVAGRHDTSLVPLPVSRLDEDDDLRTIRDMLDMEAMSQDQLPDPRTPAEFVSLLPRCRIVVAGSYHAAVFALSMGLPTVGIACSQYYVDKFTGLRDQFGTDCSVVLTNSPSFLTEMEAAVDAAWFAAQDARPRLLSAARRQIAKSEAVYDEIFSLVELRSSGARQRT